MAEERRVLLVGDGEVSGERLERADDSLTVRAVETQQAARGQLATDTFDVVVSSYLLPETDGISFLLWVHEEFPDLPTVLVVDADPATVATAAETAGVDEVYADGLGSVEALADRLVALASAGPATRLAGTEPPAVSTFHRFHEIISDPTLSFHEKQVALLDMGRERLGLELGFVTRIRDGEQTLVTVRGEHDSIVEGGQCPVGESYCRKTIAEGRQVSVTHAAEEGWVDDPAYRRFRLESYIGSHIVVHGSTYGSFCFADSEPRERPFTAVERSLVNLMAWWFGTELEREQYTSRLAVFDRVLRHNLRNNLNLVLGHVDALDAQLSAEQRTHTAKIERASEALLDLSETARVFHDSIDVGGSSVSHHSPLEHASATVEEYRNRYPNARFSVEVRSAEPVLAPETFRLALGELVENAVEHHDGTAPVVRLIVEPSDSEMVAVRVADDGPGIPEQERDLIQSGTEEQLNHIEGLGLWVVRWTTTAGGGSLTIEESESGGTVVSMHLPLATPPGDGERATIEETTERANLDTTEG